MKKTAQILVPIFFILISCGEKKNDANKNAKTLEIPTIDKDFLVDSYEFPRNELKDFPNKYKLNDDEARAILKDSAKYWQYYLEIAKERHEKDSLTFLDNQKQKKDSLSKVDYPVDKELPFGPEFLITYDFPETEYYFYYNQNGTHKESTPHLKEMFSTIRYYTKYEAKVEESHSYIELNEIEHISFDDNLVERDYFNSLKERSKDFFKPYSQNPFTYRLGNIGPYETYYHVIEKGYGECLKESRKEFLTKCCSHFYDCETWGFLILRDSLTKNAKIFNSYLILPQDASAVVFRFFYIGNSSIRFFDGHSMNSSNPDGFSKSINSLKEVIEVLISPKGETRTLSKNKTE